MFRPVRLDAAHKTESDVLCRQSFGYTTDMSCSGNGYMITDPDSGQLISIGFIDRSGPVFMIYCIVTHENYRRRGFASNMVRFLTTLHGLRHPYRALVLDSTNRKSDLLYEKLGWTHFSMSSKNMKRYAYTAKNGILQGRSCSRSVKERLQFGGSIMGVEAFLYKCINQDNTITLSGLCDDCDLKRDILKGEQYWFNHYASIEDDDALEDVMNVISDGFLMLYKTGTSFVLIESVKGKRYKTLIS